MPAPITPTVCKKERRVVLFRKVVLEEEPGTEHGGFIGRSMKPGSAASTKKMCRVACPATLVILCSSHPYAQMDLELSYLWRAAPRSFFAAFPGPPVSP